MLTHTQLTNLALSNAPTEGHSEFDPMSIATCYLAGPMRGIENFNFPAFEEATLQLRIAGWHVFSPRENDAEAGLQPSPTGETTLPLKYYMRKDLGQVASSDAVFFLPGWEDSQGALLEFQVATYLEIPCYRFEDGGRISVIDSDKDGMLLGVDHDQIEGRELFDTLLGESPEQPPLYPSAQEQLERAKNAAIIEAREKGFEPLLNSTGELIARARRGQDWYDEVTPALLAEKRAEALQGWHAESVEREVMRHPNSARFHEILKGLGELHDRKQADYGKGDDPFANVRASADFGVDSWVGAMIRLNDKIKRLQSMATKGHLVNESATDSFRDIAVYAIIAMVLFEQQYGREA